MTQNVDLPAYQEGVAQAQSLLDSVPSGNASAVVGVPPNCETLAVCVPGALANFKCQCVGVTSGYAYPGVAVNQEGNTTNSQTFYFDVSAPLDAQVNINLSSAPTEVWYVYSDSGVHVVFDGITGGAIVPPTGAEPQGVMVVGGVRTGYAFPFYADSFGTQRAVPVPPGEGSADHPVPDLQRVSGEYANAASVLPNLPGTERYRIFSIQFGVFTTGGAYGSLNDSAGALVIGQSTGVTPITFPPSGLPLGAGSGVVAGVSAGQVYAVVAYTVEQV